MAQRDRPPDDIRSKRLLDHILGLSEQASTLDERVQMAQEFRLDPHRSRWLDEVLIQRACGLAEVHAEHEQLRALFESVVAPPWYPAVLSRVVETERGPRALVMHGGAHRMVAVSEEVDADELNVGDEVYLSKDLNAIVGCSPDGVPQYGETSVFERLLDDGCRLVLRHRDEDLVVSPAASLCVEDLRPGDLLRWDRSCWLAFEKLNRSIGAHLFLEEMPQESFDNIGGLGRQTAEIQRCILRHLQYAETATRYQLPRKKAILLIGPPGVGKTMTARAFCRWLGEQSGSGRARFMNIKPAGLHSSYYAESERNYREAFQVAREAARQDPNIPVVMFFDEIDAIGAARGMSHMRVDDRVLTAFMTEIDGLEERGNVLVMAATNRPDALDSALTRPGRFGDLVIEIPRPNRTAAAEIFAKHLPADIPYRIPGDGREGAGARSHIIDCVVAQIYTPNGDGEVATLVLRDNTRRVLRVPDLISGADIAQIARAAIEQACDREIDTGEWGVRLEDVLSAVAKQRETLARVLTPANARRYVSGLPDDVDVVRVEPVVRKVKRPHLYLNAA
jgi:proteasome-associated ATPase